MELLERYLQAVEFWLPKAQKRDIIAELGEDIRSQVDERETELRRGLSEAELEDILKKRGSPLQVAQRFLPQQYLIGPTLFPIYWLVLRIVAWVYLIPWLVVWVCLMVFLPSYRAAHAGVGMLGSWASLWTTALTMFACMTVAFALVERYHVKSGFLEKWEPRKLPKLRRPAQISRANSVVEVVWYLIFLLWWVDGLRVPELPKVTVRLAPTIAHNFYWPMVVLLLAMAGIGAWNAVRPWWTQRRAVIRLAIDGLGLVLVGLMLGAGNLAQITSAELSSAQLAVAEKWVTFSWRIVLAFATMSFVARLAQDARRATGKEPYQNWAVRALVGE